MTVENDQEVHNPLFMTQTDGLDQDIHSSPSMTQKRSLTPDIKDEHPEKVSRSEDDRFVNYEDNSVVQYIYEEPFKYQIHEGVRRMPASHAAFKKASEAASDGLQCITSALREQEVGESTKGLLQQMENRMHISYGDKLYVGIVGDTGAGKSRLTNNLLGHIELAAHRGAGSSVTQVITEYHNNEGAKSGDEMWTHITFKPKERINADIREHFMTYLKFKCPRLRQSDDDSELIDEDIFAFETAKNYLLEVFAEQRGNIFSTEATLDKFIQTYPSLGHVDGTVEGLQQYCHDMIDKELESYGGDLELRRIYICHNTLEQVRNNTRDYTESPAKGKTGFWQLIDIVQTYLPSPLLRKGIVIADCPGLTDYHNMRRKASETYLKDCDMVLILSPVDRIADKPEVRKYVRNYVASHGLQNLVVVPTQTDKMEENSNSVTLSTEQKERIADHKKLHEIAEARYRAAPGKPRGSKLALKEEMQQAKAAWDRERILARNTNVCIDMQKALPDAYRHEQLTIVPVSSAQHEIYLQGKATYDFPALQLIGKNSIGEDGIGILRSLMCIRAQKDRLRTLQVHVLDRVQLPIKRLRLMLDKRPEERKQSVFDAVDKASKETAARATSLANSIGKAFDKHVYRGIEDLAGANGQWTGKIEEIVQEWHRKYPSPATIKAIARRRGCHHPKGYDESTDWLGDMIGVFDPSVKFLTANFLSEVQGTQSHASSYINGSLDKLEAALKTNVDLGSIDMTRIFSLFEDHRNNFELLLPTIFKELDEQVSKIIADLIYQETPCYFHTAMLRIYQGVNSDKRFPLGTKQITDRRWEFLEQQLVSTKNGSPISALKRDVRKRFKGDKKGKKMGEVGIQGKLEAKLRKAMQKPFNQILKDLNARFGEEVDFDDAARERLELALKESLPAAEEFFGYAKMCLEEVEDWDRKNQETETETKSGQGRWQGAENSKEEELGEGYDEKMEEEVSEESDDSELEYESEEQGE